MSPPSVKCGHGSQIRVFNVLQAASNFGAIQGDYPC